jgi:hypothetical protein
MKTTIELPDALFTEAKSLAVKRRTTLKALMEHALRREIGFSDPPAGTMGFAENEYGFPVLSKRKDQAVTSEFVYGMLEEEGH